MESASPSRDADKTSSVSLPGFQKLSDSMCAAHYAASLKCREMDMGREDLVEVVEGPLELTKYVDAVRDAGAGAIVTFAGTTRDTFDGRRVLQLEYEAYIPMASSVLRSICRAARERWSLVAIAVVHRIGIVPIGEESVFVATSSVHRTDALAACHFIIDEIKASVPIWKKEIYANGESWKENKEFFVRQPGMMAEPQAQGDRCLPVVGKFACCQGVQQTTLEASESKRV